MPVEAVLADVELAAFEPLGVGRLPVEYAVPRLGPLQRGRLLGPVLEVVGVGRVVQRAVADVGLRGKRRRRRERAVLDEEVADLGHISILTRIRPRAGGAFTTATPRAKGSERSSG